MSCLKDTSTPSSSSIQERTNYDSLQRSKNGNKKRKFRPLQGLRRIFHRQKSKEQISSVDDNQIIQKNQQSRLKRNHNEPHPVTLSISHESIFQNEVSSLLTSSSSKTDLNQARTVLSSSIQNVQKPSSDSYKAELLNALKKRRNEADNELFVEAEGDNDLGLRKNLCNNNEKIIVQDNSKDNYQNYANKSHSTCSDGSLLSIASSSFDLRSFDASKESSKLSLSNKTYDEDSEFESHHVKLNHNAAKHKIAIKPKKTRAIPKKFLKSQRVQPEVTESELNVESTLTNHSDVGKNKDILPLKIDNTPKPLPIIKSLSLPTKNLVFNEISNNVKVTRSQSNIIPASTTSYFEKTNQNRFSFERRSVNSRKLTNDNYQCVPEFLNVRLKKVEDPGQDAAVCVIMRKSTVLIDNKTTNSFENKCKSISLNDMKFQEQMKSESNSKQDKRDVVPYRQKSLIFKDSVANDDEPELMKVFARRSLLIIDDHQIINNVTENHSDKENDNGSTIKRVDSTSKTPQFKNIRQRKDEWEKRVQQQAMKK